MSSSPLISVVIPVYNAGSTLEKTLLSVIRQDYSIREIIVIDGGSSDSTRNVIQQYRNWINQLVEGPDRGVYDAMNKGIQMSKGEWLYFLGADDVFADESVLSRFFNETELTGSENILFGSVVNVDVTHKLVPTLHTSSFGKKLYWRNTLHHQSAFYHRSLFSKGGYEIRYRILADYDFHLRCLGEKTKALFIPRIVAKCGAEGLSKKFPFSLYREELRIKGSRIPMFYFLMNIPWIFIKYIAKNVFG